MLAHGVSRGFDVNSSKPREGRYNDFAALAFCRPCRGFGVFPITHGSRRGLTSIAAPQLRSLKCVQCFPAIKAMIPATIKPPSTAKKIFTQLFGYLPAIVPVKPLMTT